MLQVASCKSYLELSGSEVCGHMCMHTCNPLFVAHLGKAEVKKELGDFKDMGPC